jgi:hypothetical protein
MIRMESGLINAKSTWNILEEKLCNFISLYWQFNKLLCTTLCEI